MFELSAWDTMVYTLLVLGLMFLLSKLLAEPAPAVRIRYSSIILIILTILTHQEQQQRPQMDVHRPEHTTDQLPPAL